MSEQLEYNIGDGEQSATVEVSEDGNAAVLDNAEQAPEVSVESNAAQGSGELEEYSEKVKKRIDKLTARLRETQRREEAAINYAKSVQQRAQQLEQQFQRTDAERLLQTRSRIDTEASTLRQIIKKAREEGDTDTEIEAQERLSNILYDQRRVADAEAQRKAQYAAQQQQAAYQQQVQQIQPQQPQPDPRAEDWAERNEWFGRDVAMTAAARAIHIQLVQAERFDPTSDEYYDELDRRVRESFPQKFSGGNSANSTPNTRANRPVQTVAPATRSSGVNSSARRTVRLSPSQVAIAKKLGVPLEEYAKYVKE